MTCILFIVFDISTNNFVSSCVIYGVISCKIIKFSIIHISKPY